MPAAVQSPGALSPYRVFDLSESIAGQYCCRMLADYGAEVTLLEPPGGTITRHIGRFREKPGADRESLLFFHLNLGKASMLVDQTTEQGRALLVDLARAADVLVVPAGFERKALKAANPKLVVAVVSPFGEDGPKRNWRGTEMVYQALSGMMVHNGRRDREPLYGVGDRASYCAGIAAYSSILSALMVRERTGVAQEVAIDVALTAASMTYPFALQYSYNGTFEEREGRIRPLIEVKCADGWIAIWIRANTFGAVCEGLGAPELSDDPRFAGDVARRDNFKELVTEVQNRVADKRASDVIDALASRRVVCACCFQPTRLGPDAPHLKAREYWQTVPTADGERNVLGPQFRMSRTPWRTAAAPAFGPLQQTSQEEGADA